MQGIADYRFVRSLGEGAHGTFYLAAPPERLGLRVDQVAVKVLRGATDDETIRRTTRELRAFAAASSPYLVTLYDAGQQDGAFFYAMEYFPEGSLASPTAPITRQQVLLAVSHAARAAHALHESGVVHRSIKPENVLLLHGEGRLSDLGLAQALEAGGTVTGMGPIGAVEYVEPAILLGQRATRASDIWSLGVTLHRALTTKGVYGELPASDPLLAVRTVLSTKPVLADDLDPRDRAAIESCLMAEAAERPLTAEALADSLESLSAG